MISLSPISLNSSISITIVYGKAGTGKSTTLSSMIRKCIEKNQSFIVLTATHASLNNIYNITSNALDSVSDSTHENDNTSIHLDRKLFKTIYSFFHIDYENEIVAGCSYVPQNIFIDEFSLINKHLFKRILRSIRMKATEPVNLVLFGDMMQLNAIYSEKQYISLPKLQRISKLSKTNTLYPAVIDHLHLSIFGLKSVFSNSRKQLLSKNHRNSDNVTSLLTAIYNKNDKYSFPFIDDIHELVGLIDKGYVFVTSMYKHIQHVYDSLGKVWGEDSNKSSTLRVINQPITYRFGLKRLYLYKDAPLMLTATSKLKDTEGNPLYYNGEWVKWNGTFQSNGDLICTNANGITLYISQEVDTSIPCKPKYHPVIPQRLITIHKSQGLTIDKVIVCIDDLFDMCMMYTAITRARSDVKLFTFKGSKDRIANLFDNAWINEFKQLNSIMIELNGKNVLALD